MPRDISKTNVVLIFATICLLYSVAIEKIREHSKTPHYAFTTSSSVWFNDNIAPEMHAFIDYGDGEREMQCSYKQTNSCAFEIPKGALEAKEFTVHAVDRDGNKSKPKKLYPLDGVVLEKSPN